LCDPWRITKPTADPVQGELALQFCLSAGTPLLKLYEWNNRPVKRKKPNFFDYYSFYDGFPVLTERRAKLFSQGEFTPRMVVS
jgi:hypothetical protein